MGLRYDNQGWYVEISQTESSCQLSKETEEKKSQILDGGNACSSTETPWEATNI
jgi:hypothetical protein